LPLGSLENRITHLKSKTSPASIPFPRFLTPEIARLVGYVIADGTICGNDVCLFNHSLELRGDFFRCAKKAFGISGTTTRLRTTWRANLHSGALASLLEAAFQVPKGRKARIVSIPALIQRAGPEPLAAFLRALFDCEGSVSIREREIEFTTASRALAAALPGPLLRFGIVARVRKKPLKGWTYYRLSFYGKENLTNFQRSIGFLHKEKARKLAAAIRRGKQDTNIDVVPGAGKAFWSILQKTGETRASLAKRIGVSPGLVGLWIAEDRRPSRHLLQRIVRRLERWDAPIIANELRFLRTLARSDMLWARIEAVEAVPAASKHVYDLTVAGSHTFLAGASAPMVVSNTTVLNVLSLFIRPTLKVVSIEDTPELRLPLPHWVPHVARSAISVKGKTGEV
ncbi:MAG TPA: LAGLIDADG family homing endonuclease, partial [archaeon]|nr:LAGLIDADG family homing endonuclease [archaeon]